MAQGCLSIVICHLVCLMVKVVIKDKEHLKWHNIYPVVMWMFYFGAI